MSQRGQAFFASSAKYRPPGPPPTTLTFMVSLSLGNYRGGLDLQARLVLDQAAYLDDRHGRIVPAHELAVGEADFPQRAEVLFLVQHVPGEAHDVLRFAVCLLQYRNYVLKSLPELAGEVVRLPFSFAGPADLARDEHQFSPGCDAVGEALRFRPAGRLQDLHAHVAEPLSLKRCNLPVSVRGRSPTNSTERGYLYGAIAFFTWSWRFFFIWSSASFPALST